MHMHLFLWLIFYAEILLLVVGKELVVRTRDTRMKA